MKNKLFKKPVNKKKRHCALPEEAPKSPEEDPKASQYIKAIQHSKSYALAEEDQDFILSDETRSIRLELDYLKAESLLRQHQIKKTIVVYGSTRIKEKSTAIKNLEKAQAAYCKEPHSKTLKRNVEIAEKLLEKAKYYEIAREFGRLVATTCQEHHDKTIALATGGGPGIMEAANRGAFDVGAETIGFNISLPHEQFPNPYITPDLCFQFHYFSTRKMHFLKRACGLLVFPGGYGTLDELFEVLMLVQTRKMPPLPIVLIGEEYWERLINFEQLMLEGVIDFEDRELFWYAQNAQEAWEGMQRWHIANKTPLFEE
ncbi:TIGR00730 family Rossman fold protein [Sulfurospirillum sp. 1612]|uniref:LOG family protein n=1 Tax=Sulfurospirillum sp. 1612 TaxID=3094835 RepID=UPI002F925994